MRLVSLASLLLLAACATSSARTGNGVQQGSSALSEDQLLARARTIHERVITIDTHDDIPNNWGTPEADPLTMSRQVNLQKMKQGGLDVAFFAVFVGQTPRTP